MPTISHHLDTGAVLRLLASAGAKVTRQTLHARSASGHFPPPAFSMGPRLTYWRESDVLAFLGAQGDAPEAETRQEG